MSQIFTYWKCKHCGAEFNQYVSFGHPEECFDCDWECGECKGVNTLHVRAMPMFGSFSDAMRKCPICSKPRSVEENEEAFTRIFGVSYTGLKEYVEQLKNK